MAPYHYRCHRVYIPKTRAQNIAQTVKFFPNKVRLPQASAKHVAVDAALCIIEALRNTAPEASFVASNKDTVDALDRLVLIFEKKCPPLEENHPLVPQHTRENVEPSRVVTQAPPTSQLPGSRRNMQGCRTAVQKTTTNNHYHKEHYG